ncbi:hypothetical protein ACIQCR_14415 [Streptomyces sp. NPDC093249]|uniref:hypothetical protein n=1 Tax=unclassified Streptomyces TaxID=2593676 RepID=UPI003817AF61
MPCRIRGEALRLADRLDPDPARMDRLPPRTHRTAPPPAPTAPTDSGTGRGSEDAAAHARETPRVRSPLRLTFTDQDCAHVLSVWLSTARTTADPGVPARHPAGPGPAARPGTADRSPSPYRP